MLVWCNPKAYEVAQVTERVADMLRSFWPVGCPVSFIACWSAKCLSPVDEAGIRQATRVNCKARRRLRCRLRDLFVSCCRFPPPPVQPACATKARPKTPGKNTHLSLVSETAARALARVRRPNKVCSAAVLGVYISLGPPPKKK